MGLGFGDSSRLGHLCPSHFLGPRSYRRPRRLAGECIIDPILIILAIIVKLLLMLLMLFLIIIMIIICLVLLLLLLLDHHRCYCHCTYCCRYGIAYVYVV